MGLVFRFVWVILVFHGLSESLDIQSYIAQKEKEVRSMAAEIVRRDESRCDFARTCTCSRHACTPIGGSVNYNFECQPMEDSYQYCTAYSPAKQSQCHSRKVNYAMSYFRVAPNASSYAYKIPDEIPNEMCSTICMTKCLENSFKNSVNRSNHETFYFGSADGVQRVYPGTEAPSNNEDLCGFYDPRKRPWYNGALSIQTEYFILVDHGYLSGWEVRSKKLIKAIAASQQIVEEFVKTLSPNDVLNIVTFNETDATLIIENQVLITDDDSSINSQINNFINDIRSITTTQSTVLPSIDGFKRAVSVVSDMKFQDSKNFKVMLLLTNGKFATAFNYSQIQQVSETLTNNYTNLMIYSFENSPNLQDLARQSNGNFKVINSYYENPLYQISSYFNFMALARKKAHDAPFWSNYYTDYNGRGRIITVSYQAVSSKGSLIGVAAIDITESVLGDLSNDLGDRYGFRPRYPKGLFNVTVKSTDTVCNPPCDVSRAVCRRSSSKTFTELNCCDTCPWKEDGRNWIVIFGAVGAAILVIIGVALTMLWMMKKKNQKSKKNPIFISPASTDLGPYR